MVIRLAKTRSVHGTVVTQREPLPLRHAPVAWGRSLKRGTVSVLISAWNTEGYVERAIRSMLTQELPPHWELEVLVGVDADLATLKVVQRVAESDARVVVVSMNENVGTYSVLNTLLLLSRGSLISILDSDDIASPGRLLESIDLLKRNPGAAMVGSQSIRVPERGGSPTLNPNAGMVHSSWTCHRSLYNLLGGYKAFRCGADTDFVVRARRVGGESVMSPRPWVTCVMRRSSLCRAPETNFDSPVRKRVARAIAAERRQASPSQLKLKPSPHEVLVDQRVPL